MWTCACQICSDMMAKNEIKVKSNLNCYDGNIFGELFPRTRSKWTPTRFRIGSYIVRKCFFFFLPMLTKYQLKLTIMWLYFNCITSPCVWSILHKTSVKSWKDVYACKLIWELTLEVAIIVLPNSYVYYIENNVCARVTHCLSAHERVIFVFISIVAKQRGK